MLITPIETYRRLKEHGATFARTAASTVDVMLPAGVTLPVALDAALITHSQVIGAIAILTDLKEPRHWTRPVALVETRVVLDRIGSRLGELPEPLRTRASRDVRRIVDAGKDSIDRAFKRYSMSALRLTLLAVEGEVIEAIAAAEARGGR